MSYGRQLEGEAVLQGVQTDGETGGLIGARGRLPLGNGILEGTVAIPDRDRPTTYRDRSQYSLRYASDDTEAVLGDHVYSLSPLTDPGRFGFGAGGQTTFDAFTVGGFAHRQRYAQTGGTYGGAFAGLRVHPDAEVRANVFHNTGFRGGEAATLRGILTRADALAVDAECGLGTGDQKPTRACLAQLSVRQPGLTVHVNAIGAEPGFPGRFTDTRLLSGSAVVRPVPGVQASGAYQEYRRGETAGTLDTRVYHVGGEWSTRGLQLGVRWGGRGFASGDRAGRAEQSVRLSSGYRTGRASLRGSVELGAVESPVLDAGGPFQRYTAHARVSPAAGQSVQVGVEHRRGASLYGLRARDEWRADVGAGLDVAARTRLSLSASAALDRQVDVSSRTSSYVQAQFDHTFASGHRVELRGRHFETAGTFSAQRDEYSAAYIVPLRVPVGRRGGGQVVAGRVYDAETGAGLAGVLVSLGAHSTVTDDDGGFVLPRPLDGSALLDLSRVTAGLDRVPLGELPRTIPGGPGALLDIEIPMMRGARLTGQIGGDADTPAIRQAVIEIAGAGGRLRTVSDHAGRFAFEGVPPGPWSLRVVHADLPRHHKVEQDAYAIALSPGREAHLEIAIRPQRRQIRMIDSGTVSASATARASRRAAESRD